MARILLTAILLSVPIAAVAADDFKVSQLEQDVRDLQRQVRTQSQQIDELRAQLRLPAAQIKPPASSSRAPAGTDAWIDASKWQQLRPGMSELEVIGSLGPPTSMRNRDNERVLLYALEIGSSGFLGGSITLRDRVVVQVQKPVLQ